MKVRVGWATEFARDKFDVEMEEQDWEVLLQDLGLTAVAHLVTVTEKFALMKAEADIYAAYARSGKFPKAAEEFAAARAVKAKEVAKVKKRLDVDQPA